MLASLAQRRVPAVALVVLLGGLLGCDEADPAGRGTDAQPAASRGNRALPRFEGVRVGGGRVGTEIFRRKRGLIFLFSERDRGADALAGLVQGLAAEAAEANVALLGISRDPSPGLAQGFARRHDLEFPILHDPSLVVSRRLRAAESEAALIAVDGSGSVIFAFAGIEPGVEISVYERAVRQSLRLETGVVSISYGLRPSAPAFAVQDLEGNPLALEDLQGRVVVVMFFLHTCPHCHDALRFLDQLADRLGSEDLVVVAISLQNRVDAVKSMAATLGVDFTFYVDPERETARAYAHSGNVPDTVVLDREHRVVSRQSGIEPRIEALLTMSIRDALGAENPILMAATGYSGQESCSICHANQHETWSLTNHAYAFDSLVEHGEDRNGECLGCHVVGWNERGGYSVEQPWPWLEGVQCENCHGRGGPHQSPEFAAQGFEAVCQSCHNAEHSLRFSFAERLPLVSHAANSRFAQLSLEERRQLLARRDKRQRQLFEHGDFVGSARCQSCHAREYEIWSASPHARSFATLEARGEAGNADCQRCHTTGHQEPGGFPSGGSSRAHVGCESCHGPGGNHVDESARKSGTILALTDKCDSCVILQICGSCHDDANDPGFEFEVLDKIDLIRHGFRDREPEAAAE